MNVKKIQGVRMVHARKIQAVHMVQVSLVMLETHSKMTLCLMGRTKADKDRQEIDHQETDRQGNNRQQVLTKPK